MLKGLHDRHHTSHTDITDMKNHFQQITKKAYKLIGQGSSEEGMMTNIQHDISFDLKKMS